MVTAIVDIIYKIAIIGWFEENNYIVWLEKADIVVNEPRNPIIKR